MTAPGARAGGYGEPWKKYASMVFSTGPHGFNVCCLSAPHVPRTGPDGEACDLVEHHELEMSDPDFNAAHDRGARIVACVNACAGIADPAALLAANAALVAREADCRWALKDCMHYLEIALEHGALYNGVPDMSGGDEGTQYAIQVLGRVQALLSQGGGAGEGNV